MEVSTKMDLENKTQDIKIFNDIRNHIRRKINNVGNNFFGDEYSVQKRELYELVRRSVETKESNSAVVCGPPGCGKTALINNVLNELKTKRILTDDSGLVVRLHGLLHTDDRLSLQDITQQMQLAGKAESKNFSSFQENLVYLLEQLRERRAGYVAKPCAIFILDDFHLFCEHKNQILLYNLFDIVQSAKAPICVIGLTFQTDVMDLLEKRVLSRFSHRIIQMTGSDSINHRILLLRDLLTLQPSDLPHIDEIYKYVWNTRTNEVMEDKELGTMVKHQLDLSKSQTMFRHLMFKVFNTVTFEQPLVTLQNFKDVFMWKDNLGCVVAQMSQLEIALLVAIKQQTVSYEREPFNFEMIYTGYLKFVKRTATNLVSERAVVLKAFQRLQELEIVTPVRKVVGNATGKVPLEYQLYNFNLTVEQVVDAVKENKDLTMDIQQWVVQTM